MFRPVERRYSLAMTETRPAVTRLPLALVRCARLYEPRAREDGLAADPLDAHIHVGTMAVYEGKVAPPHHGLRRFSRRSLGDDSVTTT